DADNRRLLQLDPSDLRAELELPAGGQMTPVDRQVVPVRDWLEVVELDVLERGVSDEGRIGLSQEVGVALKTDVARLEDSRAELELGRIDAIVRGRSADVRRRE